MRLIDANTLKGEFTGNFTDSYPKALVHVLIDSAPTIDAVPVVHARWVGNNGTFCSNCGKSDANAFNHHVPYCWNCGATMDGDTNEID